MFLEDTPTFRAIRLTSQIAACDQLESLCAALEERTATLAKTRSVLANKTESLRGEYQGRIEQAETLLGTLKAELESASRKLDIAAASCSKFRDEIKRIEAEDLDESERDRVARASAFAEKPLQLEISRIRIDRDKAEKKVAELSAQLQDLTVRLDTVTTDLRELMVGGTPTRAKGSIDFAREQAAAGNLARIVEVKRVASHAESALKAAQLEAADIVESIDTAQTRARQVRELSPSNWREKLSHGVWWASKLVDFEKEAEKLLEKQKRLRLNTELLIVKFDEAQAEIQNIENQRPREIEDAEARARCVLVERIEKEESEFKAAINEAESFLSTMTGRRTNLAIELTNKEAAAENARSSAAAAEHLAILEEFRGALEDSAREHRQATDSIPGLESNQSAAEKVLAELEAGRAEFLKIGLRACEDAVADSEREAAVAENGVRSFALAHGLNVAEPFSIAAVANLKASLIQERSDVTWSRTVCEAEGPGIYRDRSGRPSVAKGNLYIGLQSPRYEETLRNQLEAIRERHPGKFFKDAPREADLIEIFREAFFPDDMLQTYLVSNLSLDEARPRLAVRPAVIGPRLEKLIPEGMTFAVLADVWHDRYSSDNPMLNVFGVLELSDSGPRAFERELNVRVFSQGTPIRNPRTRQNNAVSGEFLASIPPISLATKERLADWLAYLDWCERLTVARSKGIRYLEAVLTHEGLCRFLVVFPSKEDLERSSRFLKNTDLRVFSLANSMDPWNFRHQVGGANRKREILLGEFVRIEEADRANALGATAIPWDDACCAYAFYTPGPTDQARPHRDDAETTAEGGDANAYRETLYEEGFLGLSAAGNMALISRQRDQLLRLQQQSGYAPFLSSYIFDIKSANLPEAVQPIAGGRWIRKELNADQRLAVEKMINAPDLSLVQGPPGTGKTTMIAEAAEQLIRRGKSVLVASQANLAVDNIFERLTQTPEIRGIRLGRKGGQDNPFSESQALGTYYKAIASACEESLCVWTERDSHIKELRKWLADAEFLAEDMADIKKRMSALEGENRELQRRFVETKVQDGQSTDAESSTENETLHGYEVALRNNAIRRKELQAKFRSQAGRLRELILARDATLHANVEIDVEFARSKAEAQRLLVALEAREAQSRKVRSDWEPMLKDWSADLRSDDRLESDRIGFMGTYLASCNIVGVTCTENPWTLERSGLTRFDVAIVDEVSKATPPELVMPMMLARKSILVGDHRQLPPLFKEGEGSWEETFANLAEGDADEEAAGQAESDLTQENFDRFRKMVTSSLFKEHFENAADELKAFLLTQYRMHPQIMEVINQFYENRLVCGLEDPDGSKPGSNPAGHRVHGLTLQGAGRRPYLEPDKHVLWLDSSRDPLGRNHYESSSGMGGKHNELEVALIAKCLFDLEFACRAQGYGRDGKGRREVGVVTFYRQQVRSIRNAKAMIEDTLGEFSAIKVDVETVDRYQGQERPIVLVSLVRNRPGGYLSTRANTAQFERINVAFSRARELLIIVGAAETFRKYPVELPNLDRPGSRQVMAYKNIIQGIAEGGGYYISEDLIGAHEYSGLCGAKRGDWAEYLRSSRGT